MSALEELLVVQEHDSVLEQLQHRLASLPQRPAIEALRRTAAENDAEMAEVRTQHDTLLRDEHRLDDEATGYEAKRAAMEARLYSGSVTAPKELQSMQAEVEQFRRLRTEFEDRELELMEQREVVDARLAAAEGVHATHQRELERLGAELAAEEASIGSELEVARAERDRAAAKIGSDLLAIYEDRRAKNRGAGVARLVGTTCQGCHLSVPSSEADALRKATPDTVAFCDNCGAILVVT